MPKSADFIGLMDPTDLRNTVYDLQQRIKTLEQEVLDFNKLDEAAPMMGDLYLGRFFSGTFDDDGHFTGGVVDSPGYYDATTGQYYCIYTLDDGVLQVGLSREDGGIYFGAGAGRLDVNGLTFANNATLTSIRFLDAAGAVGGMMYMDSGNRLQIVVIDGDLAREFNIHNLDVGGQINLSQIMSNASTPSLQIREDPANANVLQADLGVNSKLTFGGDIEIHDFGSHQYFLMKENTKPSSPTATHRLFYPKTDGWYDLDSAGTEAKLGGGIVGMEEWVYLVYLDNDGITYKARNGRTGADDFSSTTKTTLFQAAIDQVYAWGGGIIQTREVTIPETGLTHYAAVTLIETYHGTGRKFYVLPDGNLIKLGMQHGIIDRPSIPSFLGKLTGAVILKNGYLTIAQRDSSSGTEASSEAHFPEPVGYGTYEWKAKVTTPAIDMIQFVGFGEEAPSQYKDGIFVQTVDTDYIFKTFKANAYTQTVLTGQNWTTEKTFKIIWAANSAKLYVNGSLVATHTTNVPSANIAVFIETQHAAAQAEHTYVYGREWTKL